MNDKKPSGDEGNKPPKPSLKKLFIFSIYAFLATFGLIYFSAAISGEDSNTKCEKTFSDLDSILASGNVEKIEMLDESNILNIYSTEEAIAEGECEVITFRHPETMEGMVISKFDASGVPYEIIGPDSWAMLFRILIIVVLFAVFIWYLRSRMGAGGQVKQFNSKMLKRNKSIPKVRYSDVAGIEEVLEEVEEIRDFLKNPDRYREMGAKIPKGVLLFGPPGTGKTLLAQATAGEAGVPFLSISGSDFVEMFVGVGASRVRNLFDEAKKSAPSIIFIDEIDAVGRHRGAGMGGGHDEREQTLNQLLVEMDGFSATDAVVVMAATNRPDILDPALLRPGRFARQIGVSAPDLEGRKKILDVHAKGKPLDETVDLGRVAQNTAGFTGDDLSNLLNEASILAVRRKKEKVSMQEFEDSFDRVVLKSPAKKNKLMSPEERRITAFHEAGHALVGYVLPDTDPVVKISIVSHGSAGGFTMSIPEEDRSYYRRKMLLDKLAGMYGGRIAEELILGKDDYSTGASNDIEQASKLIRRMITEFGMSEKLGALKYGSSANNPFVGREMTMESKAYSEYVAQLIDQEAKEIASLVMEEAEAVINKHRDALDAMAEYLLEHESIAGPKIDEIFGQDIKNSWNRVNW